MSRKHFEPEDFDDLDPFSIMARVLGGGSVDEILSEAVLFSPGTLVNFNGIPARLTAAVAECGAVEDAVNRIAAGESANNVANSLLGFDGRKRTAFA